MDPYRNNSHYPYPYYPSAYGQPSSGSYSLPPPTHAPYHPYPPPPSYAPPPSYSHYPTSQPHSGPSEYSRPSQPPAQTIYSGPLDYSRPPQPPAQTSHFGQLDYHRHSVSFSGSFDYNRHSPYSYPSAPAPYPAHQPTLQYHGSFGSYDSAHYTPPEFRPQELSSSQSFSGHHKQDNVTSAGPTHDSFTSNGSPYPSLYPPVDHLLSEMRISDSRPTAPVSTLAPSAPPSSATPPSQQSSYFTQGTPVDSYVANAYSGNAFAPYLGRLDSSNTSVHGYSGYTGSPHNPSTHIVPFVKGSLKVLLLHGNCDIWIYDAKNLPNMDMFHRTLGDVFSKLPGNMSNKIEGQLSTKITSDPYVSVSVAGSVIGRTYVMSNSENPVWMQHFYVPVAHKAAEVHFVVKDNDFVGSQMIGIVTIPVEQIYSGARVEGTYPILNSNGKPCKPGAVLSLSIQYTPMEKLSLYHHGVGAGPEYLGVLGTYFPLRKGGTVTLYQDADVPSGSLPDLKLDSGMSYVHGRCWSDMFDAIRQARRLVYIAGWSVWHKVRLIRDGGPASQSTLGDLLRSKSQEGVRVLLLVWDDPTSRSILGFQTDGVMATHDEETRRFFKNSSVQVLLSPRISGKRHSWVKQKETETIYTHHQKTVIVDADAGNNRRKIIAFVGGLDLCDGRYDTPEHPLFRTLQTVHKDDYHNPTYTGDASGCPREPWHDLHSKIDGPAAYDILTNFEERWLKASKPQGIKRLKKKSYDDALLRLERVPDILGILDAPSVCENDPEAWHTQVFRSIDSNSVKGFPKDPKDATSKNLVCGKNVLIDMSIHTAYVKAIRAAQHFIYIENQYFIGSSYNWNTNKGLGANNLIPMEIALKIADKIRAHERFAAYIIIPMWPEGVPTGAATQRILFWQNKTMQMMYETIYRALVEVGLEDAFSPQDYLNFFCLGNREVVEYIDNSSTGSPANANTPQALCRKSRRFMIYVHSKGMIVDDEYVILGSANINQRSMEGTRDTEIAMGAYQPQHTWARKLSSPRGQIFGYRMSLWAEHMGKLEECFTQPESVECVRKVRTMGEMNWEQFAAKEVSEMKGHLLKYPVEIDRRGKVKPLPGCETFPDVGGNIVGSFLGIQENLTI